MQQSQPTIAPVVPNHRAPTNQVMNAMPSNSVVSSRPQPAVAVLPVTKPPPTIINHQVVVIPKTEACPTPQAVAKSTCQPVTQHSQPAVTVTTKVTSPPPPASTPPSAPTTTRNSSPAGVGPTYTHPETGTTPPIFHYMPAPPNNIVQDNTPESFTKLW